NSRLSGPPSRAGPRAVAAATEGEEVEDFALLDHRGVFHQLHDYADRRAIVLIGHRIGCPILRQSGPSLRELSQRYAGRGVVFLLLNATPDDDRAALQAEAEA